MITDWRKLPPTSLVGRLLCHARAMLRRNSAMLPAMRWHAHTAESHVSKSGTRAMHSHSGLSSGTYGPAPVST